jgi:hypothetical protein
VKSGGMTFTPCNSGHCSYPRLKDRSPADTCKHFESRIVFKRRLENESDKISV